LSDSPPRHTSSETPQSPVLSLIHIGSVIA
jgi:hypothetical protein